MKSFIREFRKKAKMTQGELAHKANINQAFLSDIERGKSNPSIQTLKNIAVALNISISQLLDGPDTMTIPGLGEVHRYDSGDVIPLLGKIPAGSWRDWEDSYPAGFAEEYVPRYDLKGKHIFAIRVDGDSMEPELSNGDILVVDPEKAFQPRKGGRIGVVKCDDGYQIRRVHIINSGNSYLLEPMNKAYEPEVVPVTGTTIFKIMEWRPRREEMF
ncbi:XRE family transcriptional regulator [Candidatus Latescibacterota bacterium]